MKLNNNHQLNFCFDTMASKRHKTCILLNTLLRDPCVPKTRTNKLRGWRGTNFTLQLKIKHSIRFAPRAACSLFSTSAKKLSLQEKCPANWFVKKREGVRGETGTEISPFFLSRQVKCAVRPGQWSRPFTCKDEVYGASRVLWPVFRLQLRGTKA